MLGRLLREDRGSVLVIVAVGVPTFIVIAALALDFGNWYAHRRQVQNQVDAAAFAAGVAYGYNFPACITTPAATNNIIAKAMEYGSPPDNGSTPATVNPDPCQPQSAGDYASPPGTMWTEVTVRDKVATLFGGFGFSPTISAKARVAVMDMQGASNLRPFATADTLYTDCAWVSAGGHTFPLNESSTPGQWTTNSALFEMPGGGGNLPVSVTLGEKVNGSCSSPDPTQSITYPRVGFITGWPKTRSGATFFDIALGEPPPSCNAYFVARTGSACTFSVSATIQFDQCNQADPPTVIAHFGGDTPQNVTLTQPTPCSGTGFSGSNAVVAPGLGSDADGTVPVWIEYHAPIYNNGVRVGQHDGTFGSDQNPLQSVMAGDDRYEGPIENFTLSQTTAQSVDPGDLVGESVVLTLQPLGNGGPTTLLRGSSENAHSLSGSIQCTSANPAQDAVRAGCAGLFTKSTANSSSCAGATPSCVTAGAPTNNTPAFSCTPNQWPTSPTHPRGDPRLIEVAVTPVGAPFADGEAHAITDFTAFYVTGWDGGAGCSGNDPKPSGQTTYGGAGGAIWGHFVKFVQASSAGAPGSANCDPQTDASGNAQGVSTCIATLVQ